METEEFVEQYEKDLIKTSESFNKLTDILENLITRVEALEEEDEKKKTESEEEDEEIKTESEEEDEEKKTESEEEDEKPVDDEEEEVKKDEPQKPKMERKSFVGYEINNSVKETFKETLNEYFKKL